MMILTVMVPAGAGAQSAAVNPDATQILKRMTDYLGRLQTYSVHTQNTVEDLLPSGQRIDMDVAATVTVSRPSKLRAEREGDVVHQVFYYDGASLTLYDPDQQVYATVDAPKLIEPTLDFARESLGLNVPAADLVYRNAFSLLMEGVTSAMVVGKSVVGGVRCDHLAFSRPDVDFQVWVADSGDPLPHKYVVTDTATPARLSVSTTMTDWAVGPAVKEVSFSFSPPAGAKAIEFMTLDGSSPASR
jgi:hypothetical protein